MIDCVLNCAPFKKVGPCVRNQLTQTNGVLFRRPRSRSENRIALANRTIDGDLLMVRWHYSRGSGKWCVFFASIDYNTIFVAQNELRTSSVDDVRTLIRALKVLKLLKAWGLSDGWRTSEWLGWVHTTNIWFSLAGAFWASVITLDQSLWTDWLVSVRLRPFHRA